MAERFEVPIAVRGYELDSNGHFAGTVMLQYAQHARWECLRAAGVDQRDLLASGIGPVSLEERIRFHRELRAGDEVNARARLTSARARRFASNRRSSALTGPSPPRSPTSAACSTSTNASSSPIPAHIGAQSRPHPTCSGSDRPPPGSADATSRSVRGALWMVGRPSMRPM